MLFTRQLELVLRCLETGYPGTLLLSSDTLVGNELLFDRTPWLTMLAIAIALVCWVPFVGDITRTIQEMVRATGSLAERRWGARVKVKRTDELGQLSDSINRMADQLEDHVHGQNDSCAMRLMS